MSDQHAGRPLRIALVAPPFVRVPPIGYGGTERVIAELARRFVGLGHRVTLFATADSRLPRCRTRSLFAGPLWPPTPAAERAHAAWASAELDAGDFDVVHGHAPELLRYAASLGPPLFHTAHHGPDEACTELYPRATGVHFICISARQAALLGDCLPRRPRVILHGLDPGDFAPGDGRSGRALFLGRLDAEKAPHLAIDAALAAGLGIDVAGRPHGGDCYEQEVSPRLRRRGVAHVGELAGQAKRRALAEAAVLLFTSVWEEPFGLAAIEALLSGTPVVALRRGALPELIEPGLTGFLADHPAELPPLVRAAITLDRKRIRTRAQARFSSARMAAEHLALFQRVVADSRPEESRPALEAP